MRVMSKVRGNNSDVVYQSMLEDMRHGVILPGDKLAAETLGRNYQVSRTVIREVLARLEQNNIVERTVNAGCRMRIFSLRELCDMFEIREAVEKLAVEKLTACGATPEEIASLRKYSDQWILAKDPIEREGADRNFHQLICSSCGSSVLQKVAVDNYIIFNVFNNARHFLDSCHPKRSRSEASRDEHHAIVEAIAAGDVKLAGKRLAAHIASARKRFERMI